MKRSTQRRRAMTILFSLFCSGFPSSIYKRTTLLYLSTIYTSIYVPTLTRSCNRATRTNQVRTIFWTVRSSSETRRQFPVIAQLVAILSLHQPKNVRKPERVYTVLYFNGRHPILWSVHAARSTRPTFDLTTTHHCNSALVFHSKHIIKKHRSQQI